MLDKSKTNLTLGFDDLGTPVFSSFTPSLFGFLFSAGFYRLCRLFKSNEKKERERKSIAQFIAFLERVKPIIDSDEMGKPTVSLMVEEEKPPVKKKRHKKKKKVEAIAESREDTPLVIEGKDGTVIYQIQNFKVYFTAEVVQQLNMNPKEVINQLPEQIKETMLNAIAKAEKE